MVKIPTYETSTDARSPQSRVRPQLQSGASSVYQEAARLAETAGNVAATLTEKHTKIRQDQEFFDAFEKLQKGDPENNQPGVNELFTTASSSSDFENALVDFDTASKAWMNQIADGLEDKIVKERFLLKGSESLLSNYLQAERTIYGNARESYNITIKEQVNNSISNYISATNAKNTLGAAQAFDELFGKKDADGNIVVMSYGERLKDRGMLPDGVTAKQFDDNTEAALETVYAADLIENNPAEFIRLDAQGFFDKLDASKLPALREKAKNNLTSQTINSLLTYLPIDGNRSFEESANLFAEATAGTFGGQESFVNLYNTLDQEGKNIFQDAINSRHNQQKSEISAKRNNDLFREQEANKEIFDKSLETLTTTLSISEINSQDWQGEEGFRMQQQLSELVVKREAGELPTDQGMQQYNQIFPKIVNKEITSLTQQFTLPGETVAKSIIERTGGMDGIGYNQFNTFNNLIKNRTNDDFVRQEAEFQKFLQAYEPQVMGSPAMLQFNTFADARFFDFTLAMRAAYEAGLAQGKAPSDLLFSTSPDFILRDINAYVPTNDTMMKEMMQSLIPETEVPQSKLDWEATAPQKPTDMPFAEFTLTDEYKEWKAREPE